MAWQDPQGRPEWRDPYGPEPQDTPPPGYPAPDPYAQDPYGWSAYGQDPYAQYAPGPYGPYAQDRYAQYGYAAYGPPVVARRAGARGATVGALVANIAAAIFCLGLGLAWIPGVILAAIALSKNSTDPDAARRLTAFSWICLAADLVLTVVALILIGVYAG